MLFKIGQLPNRLQIFRENLLFQATSMSKAMSDDKRERERQRERETGGEIIFLDIVAIKKRKLLEFLCLIF